MLEGGSLTETFVETFQDDRNICKRSTSGRFDMFVFFCKSLNFHCTKFLFHLYTMLMVFKLFFEPCCLKHFIHKDSTVGQITTANWGKCFNVVK